MLVRLAHHRNSQSLKPGFNQSVPSQPKNSPYPDIGAMSMEDLKKKDDIKLKLLTAGGITPYSNEIRLFFSLTH